MEKGDLIVFKWGDLFVAGRVIVDGPHFIEAYAISPHTGNGCRVDIERDDFVRVAKEKEGD